MSTVKTFRDFAYDSLRAFVYTEGFTAEQDHLVHGVAYVANVIGHYTEESVHLHPEILITTDVRAIAQTLPTHRLIPIATEEISLKAFQGAVKSCAPLARDNWIIYFEIMEGALSYGLLASGVSQPNPSPYSHLKIGFSELTPPVIYIKALSPQVLLVKGKKGELVLSFSIDVYEHSDVDHFTVLAEHITVGVDPTWRTLARDLLIGLFEQQANDASHGCLIAVLNQPTYNLEDIKAKVTNGIFIPEPIDIVQYMIEAQQTKDSSAQMELISICGLVKRMIGHDGITLFSSDGCVLAYNLFVPSNDDETRGVIGGARSRAYGKLCSMTEISCALSRSEDGPIKISWRKDNEDGQ